MKHTTGTKWAIKREISMQIETTKYRLRMHALYPLSLKHVLKGDRRAWFHGVMVSTQDFESCDPSSNLGGTWNLFTKRLYNFTIYQGNIEVYL